jgi:hypothetical protein
LGGLTRTLLLKLPVELVVQSVPGMSAGGMLLAAVLPRIGLAFPSAGRALLGFEAGRFRAGGGTPSRWLGWFGAILLLGALGSGILSGRAFQVGLLPLDELSPTPGLESNLDWSELPLFQLAGRWPIRITSPNSTEPEVARVSMGYAENIIPTRYLPSVTFDWEKAGVELRIEGPRTRADSAAFVEALQFDKAGTAVVLRICDARCLYQLTHELDGLRQKIGNSRILKAELRPWRSPFLKGVTLAVETQEFKILRALPLLQEGALQPITLLARKTAGPATLEPINPAFFAQLLGNLGAQESLLVSRAFVDGRIERVNLKDLLGNRGGLADLERALKTPESQQELRSRKDILQGIQHLLIAKLTLEPSVPDVYLHLGGTSYLLWKHALALRDSGTSHSARRVILTVRKYLEDFKQQGAAQLRQIDQIWGEIEKIEKK